MERYIEVSNLPNIEITSSKGKKCVLLPFERLYDIPAADVVEVVRCKDCSYSEDRAGACLYCKINCCLFNRDGFCSYGERREQ